MDPEQTTWIVQIRLDSWVMLSLAVTHCCSLSESGGNGRVANIGSAWNHCNSYSTRVLGRAFRADTWKCMETYGNLFNRHQTYGNVWKRMETYANALTRLFLVRHS